MLPEIIKYPRTLHIEGSRCQPGDEDLENVPFEKISGRHIVIEEKMDGANSGISFSSKKELLLQSRGHYLTGGAREKHFDLFKTWANTYKNELWEILGSRYVMYGEWLYAKHTVFYNELPHYFMEFDILDRDEMKFLDTENRMKKLDKAAFIGSVLVLFKGKMYKLKELISFIGRSYFINNTHLDDLLYSSKKLKLDYQRVSKETDNSDLMEGLYIKVEEGGIVKDRYKYIRKSFLTGVLNSESHWLDRPIIPNILKDGFNIL